MRLLLLQYLLAMVYVYFRRAELPLEAYNRTNFFVALYVGSLSHLSSLVLSITGIWLMTSRKTKRMKNTRSSLGHLVKGG